MNTTTVMYSKKAIVDEYFRHCKEGDIDEEEYGTEEFCDYLDLHYERLDFKKILQNADIDEKEYKHDYKLALDIITGELTACLFGDGNIDEDKFKESGLKEPIQFYYKNKEEEDEEEED